MNSVGVATLVVAGLVAAIQAAGAADLPLEARASQEKVRVTAARTVERRQRDNSPGANSRTANSPATNNRSPNGPAGNGPAAGDAKPAGKELLFQQFLDWLKTQ